MAFWPLTSIYPSDGILVCAKVLNVKIGPILKLVKVPMVLFLLQPMGLDLEQLNQNIGNKPENIFQIKINYYEQN